MSQNLVMDLEQLSETFNHFLPYVLSTLEKEGAFKYTNIDYREWEKKPFAERPKLDLNELKKYQVVFHNKKDGFFSKAWKNFWGKEDDDKTYRIKIIKLVGVDEVYED